MPPRRRSFEDLDHRRSFGARVHALRLARDWSQELLAEKADLHRTYISKVERGSVNISIDAMDRLARGLEVSIADLFESSAS